MRFCPVAGLVCIGLLALTGARGDSVLSPPRLQFGRQLVDLFAMNSTYINLNHGSYGVVPRVVTADMHKWDALTEECPDCFYRYTARPLLSSVLISLAHYVSADPADVVFIENASEGVNTIIRSMRVPPGKKLLYLNTAYGMVKNVMHYKSYFDTQGPVELIVVNISMPATSDTILEEVSSFLDAHGDDIYLASFSHIASLPAIILPVKELVALCAKHGVLTLIDGAHALGQIPVNVTDINANFWLGNGHKWLYSPKGSAILWARKDSQSWLVPTTISEWPGSFQDQFIYVGTTSYAPFLAMKAALDFRISIGGESAIFSYIHDLAVRAGQMLASAWATDVLLDQNMYAAMVDVRVPTRNLTVAAAIPLLLLERYNTWVPVYDIGSLGGSEPNTFYARVSLQVYNDESDVRFLANAILDIVNQYEMK